MLLRQQKAFIAVLIGVAVWGSCRAEPEHRLAGLTQELAVAATWAHGGSAGAELAAAQALGEEARRDLAGQRARTWSVRSYRRAGRMLDDAEIRLARARNESVRAEALARQPLERPWPIRARGRSAMSP